MGEQDSIAGWIGRHRARSGTKTTLSNAEHTRQSSKFQTYKPLIFVKNAP